MLYIGREHVREHGCKENKIKEFVVIKELVIFGQDFSISVIKFIVNITMQKLKIAELR